MQHALRIERFECEALEDALDLVLVDAAFGQDAAGRGDRVVRFAPLGTEEHPLQLDLRHAHEAAPFAARALEVALERRAQLLVAEERRGTRHVPAAVRQREDAPGDQVSVLEQRRGLGFGDRILTARREVAEPQPAPRLDAGDEEDPGE
ncbi:MAG: hypothetical protein IPJ77_17690 [Planctomycetes bacterium]|nr:hypothetical protein [Planctomycetota bacterium]